MMTNKHEGMPSAASNGLGIELSPKDIDNLRLALTEYEEDQAVVVAGRAREERRSLLGKLGDSQEQLPPIDDYIQGADGGTISLAGLTQQQRQAYAARMTQAQQPQQLAIAPKRFDGAGLQQRLAGTKKDKIRSSQKSSKRALGITAVSLLVAGGGILGAKMMWFDSAVSDAHADAQTNTNLHLSTSEQDILSSKVQITAADFGLGGCFADNEDPLVTATLTGDTKFTPKYTVEGEVYGVTKSENEAYLMPVTVKNIPIEVMACAPAEARADVVTIVDGKVTVKRDALMPEILPLAGEASSIANTVKPKPESGLTEAMAATITKALNDKKNQKDVATLAQDKIVGAFSAEGSPSLRSLELELDKRLLLDMKETEQSFNDAQGNTTASTLQIAFTGKYKKPQLQAVDGIVDIEKRLAPLFALQDFQTESPVWSEALVNNGKDK